MTRGDQRDRARAKNLAKGQAGANKKSGDPVKRKEADMEAMRIKAEEKAAKLAAEANGTAQPDKKKAAPPKKA